ncbi:hypothetical protein THAOC_25435, partial [Thalassiosira oceanica]
KGDLVCKSKEFAKHLEEYGWDGASVTKVRLARQLDEASGKQGKSKLSLQRP